MRNTNRKNNQLRNIELICDYNPTRKVPAW